jgi:PAS domain S-box-containing protein
VALKDRLELLMISIYGAAAVLLLFLRLWTATRARIRWRLRWLALSAAAALLPLAILYGIPVALRIPPGPVGELSVFPLCLLPLGFAAALFQERTVDLDRSLRRAVQGTLGMAVLLGGAFLLSWILGRLTGGESGGGMLTEVILPLGGSALLMMLLRGPTRRVTQSLFGGRPPALGQVLPELRTVLSGEIDLDELARGLLNRLVELFRLDSAVLLVREGSESRFRRVPSTAEAPGGPTPILGDRFAAELATREVVFLDEDGSPPGVGPVRFAGCRYLFPLSVRGDLKAILLTGSHRDGAPLEAEALESLSLIADQAARSVDAARLHQEIRERILREEKLRGETEAILEASGIGILLADRQGSVTQANRAAAAILGQDSLKGAPLDRLLPRGLLLLLDRSRRGNRSGAQDRAFRYSFSASDGRTRVINVTRTSLARPGDGGHVYTLDDVTEETRLEEKMVRQDHLASMGLLASQVAHEVNTPLTGIASYAQILMARLSSKLPEMDLLRKIESQAFRAAGIAGSVLNFARRREGEGFQLLDPGPVIADCLSLFEPHLKGKRIRVSTQRAACLPATRMNRGRAQQAVMNLLLNAAHALPEGGEIGVATDYQGAHLRIRVTDNGVGIPAAIQARIFEPFFTTRPAGEGTGLGLSIVRQIAREHGGRVEVESRQGAGSTFTLLFPAAEVLAAARKTAHG